MTVSSSEAPSARPAGSEPGIVVLTGMSGAGKASAVRLFEDIGFAVVDNVAPELLLTVAEHAASAPDRALRLVLVVDARAGAEFGRLLDALRSLRERFGLVRVLFLDASDSALVQRFKENRRPHPVPTSPGGILASIAAERALLAPAREVADRVIDTSTLTLPEMRSLLETAFSDRPASERLTTTVVSFGFKHGLPLDADLVFDVRFLRNPFWIAELRPFPGTEPAVRDYVLADPNAAGLLRRIQDIVEFTLPLYEQEGKSYLTIAIGCTGGRHRSVAVAESLAENLGRHGRAVCVQHRDCGADTPAEVVQ